MNYVDFYFKSSAGLLPMQGIRRKVAVSDGTIDVVFWKSLGQWNAIHWPTGHKLAYYNSYFDRLRDCKASVIEYFNSLGPSYFRELEALRIKDGPDHWRIAHEAPS